MYHANLKKKRAASSFNNLSIHKVCYHNFSGIADYGKLGHGEVVGMTIPESSIGDFAKEYFSLFSPKGGEWCLSEIMDSQFLFISRSISDPHVPFLQETPL